MKYMFLTVLMLLSLHVFADDCSSKAIMGVKMLGKINHFPKLFDVKVVGTQATQGDGTQLLLSARDLHDHPYAFAADVAQSEGPCVLLSVIVTDRP